MIIKTLKLKNFGQHSNMELQINGPIVGIVGKNGSGKSTIVTALQYAFTGDTTNNIQTYIKKGEASAEIECIFEKNGKEGIIKRGITQKGTTRSLVYGDQKKPITKAKEFDLMMDQILGVDKQNILSAIFISQGEIANILSPRLSERLSLFSKLLNLNFLSKRSYAVDQVLTKLRSSVTDVGSFKNNLEIKLSELNTKTETWEKNVQEANMRYVDEDFVKQISEAVTDYVHKQSEHARWESSLQAGMEKIAEIRKNFLLTAKDLGSEDEEEAIKIATSKLEEEEKNLNRSYALLQNKEIIKSTWSNLKNAWNDVKQFEQLRDTVFYEFPPNEVKDIIAKYDLTTSATLELQRCKEKIDQISKDKENCVHSIESSEARIKEIIPTITSLEQKRTVHNTVVSQLNALKQTKLKLKNKVNKDTASCPICGLKLMLGQEVCDGDITEIDKNIDHITTNELPAITRQLNELTSIKAQCEGTIRFNKQKLSDLETQEKEHKSKQENLTQTINENIIGQQYSNIISNYTEIKSKLPYYSTLWEKNQVTPLSTSVQQSIESLRSMGVGDVEHFSIESLDGDIAALGLSLRETQGKIESYKNILLKLTELKSSKSTQEHSLEDIKKNITQINDSIRTHKLMQIRSSIEGDIKLAYVLETFNQFISVSEVGQIASAAMETYRQLQAEHQVIQNLEKQIESDKALIAKLEASNAKAYSDIEELSRIKQLLQPQDGVIKNYINYLFKSISGYISEYLAYMNANFIIQIEDRASEEDLSFKFQRTDKPGDKYWYPMYQLSGGQKIKLSIAFQLAIQRIICPDLGFLVLDEPTTHLDKESIRALGELLENIGNMLMGQGGQVWIVDHNSIIDTAFTTAIKLS